jgi:hypothetical protein
MNAAHAISPESAVIVRFAVALIALVALRIGRRLLSALFHLTVILMVIVAIVGVVTLARAMGI